MRIDWWTLGLQTVNVLILVAILAHFLFRPVIAIMEERRAAAAKLMSDAEAEKAKAITAREVAQAESAKIVAARDAVLRQAAADANAERAAALATAKAEADQSAPRPRRKCAGLGPPRRPQLPTARRGSRSTSPKNSSSGCRTQRAWTDSSRASRRRWRRCRTRAATALGGRPPELTAPGR